MSDLYLKLVNTPIGKSLVQSLNLPSPVNLERWQRNDQPFLEGSVLLGWGQAPQALDALNEALTHKAITLKHGLSATTPKAAPQKSVAQPLDAIDPKQRFKALVFDATGISKPAELRCLLDFFKPVIRSLARSGRVLVIGTDPACCTDPSQAAAQKSLEGFVRSVGKEIGKKGATAQLIWIEPGAAGQLVTPVRFFLSPKSAYISGQVIRLAKAGSGKEAASPVLPLSGKTALVTGASRGIGESIAQTLARDGATVICLDVPGAAEATQAVAGRIKGHALNLDITDAQAPAQIADFIANTFKGVDLVVHNAGVTRDKTLARMPEHFWDLTIAVNLDAEETINHTLLARKLINKHGRIVCVSSISGIAGNFGQTNYATSKCGVIGYVEALAKQLDDGITINAVAPGFIETQMTAAMPITIREAGRRMNSLSQGGLPVDVAEAIGFFCHPLTGGINGNILRVCGQSLIGK